MPLTKKIINDAMSGTHWDLTNKVLYDLCKKHPRHQDYPEILAKTLIIGRTYAAAIERRKTGDAYSNEDYYINKVADMIWNSDIDYWFDDLKNYKTINKNSVSVILDIHFRITKLFSEISDLKKRSLASKYLHFHFPNLYFIYDSRAVQSMSKLSPYIGRVGKSSYISDNEYRKLFEKCLMLKKYIDKKYNVNITPRQIDTLLLTI